MFLFYIFSGFISFVLFTLACKIHDGFVNVQTLLIALLLSLIHALNILIIIAAASTIIGLQSKSSFWNKKVF